MHQGLAARGTLERTVVLVSRRLVSRSNCELPKKTALERALQAGLPSSIRLLTSLGALHCLRGGTSVPEVLTSADSSQHSLSPTTTRP